MAKRVDSTNTERQKRFLANCDRITVQPQLDIGAQIREAAKASGVSVRGYILEAVRTRMHNDGLVMGE